MDNDKVECCATCEEPKFPYRQEPGQEVENGWPGCVNPQCPAYGEQNASASFCSAATAMERLQITLNNLRQTLMYGREERHDG